MARDSMLNEALPPREFVISNTASASALLHPAIRPVGAATDFVTDVGAGNQAQVQLNLVSEGVAVQNAVLISTGAAAIGEVTGVTVTTGTQLSANFIAGQPYTLAVLADATGLVDVTFTYGGGGATSTVISYGPYQVVAAVPVTT